MEFFVGTYSSEAGRGVYPLSYDAGVWTLGAPDTRIENCSYAAFDPRTGVHYLLNEGDGTIRPSLWRAGQGWTELQNLPAFGDAPCFVAVEEAGYRVAIASYGDGYIVTYQADRDDGSLGNPVHVHDHTGRGPDPERQDGPHAHCVRFRGKALYSTDLGTDCVWLHQDYARAGEEGGTRLAFKAPPGEGPRHILFHPHIKVAYLLTELGSKVFVLAIHEDGSLSEIERFSALPAGFEGESLGGHIAMNAAGDRLYVSNRGHDSLAVFAIADDGRLALLGHALTHGQSPRFFLLSETTGHVIVAHQDGGSVVVLALNDDGSVAEPVATFAVPQAAFVGVLGGG